MRALFLMLAAFATSASAQSTQTFGEKIWWSSSSNRFAAEVSRAAGVPHPGIPYINDPNYNAAGLPYKSGAFAPNPGSWPSANMRGNLPGNGPVIDVSAKFKPASAGAAIGRFAAKLAFPVTAGMALYDLAQDLGFTFASGNEITYQPPPTPSTYRVSGGAISATPQAACVAFVPYWQSLNGSSTISNPVLLPGDICQVTQTRNTSPFTVTTFSLAVFVIAGTPGTPQPASTDDLADLIASQSGWPSDSPIVDVLKQAVESGEHVELETPTVSGPSSSPGPSSSTTNTTNNTTSNTTTTNNYTYEGNEVTVTQTTVTNITNNTTGATTTETTQSQTPPKPSEIQPPPEPFELPCGIAGKPPCDVKVDETGTEVYDPEKFKLPEDLKTKTDELLETVSGDTDKAGLFDSFRSLFTLPPLRECEAIQFPEVAGMAVPSLNPCPATDWLRGIMAFVWAVAGLAFCWSCVEEATKA